jgi:uncharacterized damage-inducible protein DinB
MLYTIQEFVTLWNNESAATLRVMNLLTDASLQQEIAPNHRKLGQLAWHLAATIHEMPTRTGLVFPEPEGGVLAPGSASVIAETYQQVSLALVDAIQTQWADAKLTEYSDMYGEQWLNSTTLEILVAHEIHQRGQMTVLMRQEWLSVPDMYGPTRDNWLEWGIEPHI